MLTIILSRFKDMSEAKLHKYKCHYFNDFGGPLIIYYNNISSGQFFILSIWKLSHENSVSIQKYFSPSPPWRLIGGCLSNIWKNKDIYF